MGLTLILLDISHVQSKMGGMVQLSSSANGVIEEVVFNGSMAVCNWNSIYRVCLASADRVCLDS